MSYDNHKLHDALMLTKNTEDRMRKLLIDTIEDRTRCVQQDRWDRYRGSFTDSDFLAAWQCLFCATERKIPIKENLRQELETLSDKQLLGLYTEMCKWKFI